MTAGELIAAVDALRPNHYEASQKLEWLRLLDGKICSELLWAYDDAPDFPAAPYTAASELLAPFPYDWELYTSWLFSQIDLHNAEIVKYDQSMTLFASAWRQAADWINRTRRPQLGGAWQY